MLGVSTSRDDGGSIGQFGSGNKHGINVLLRQGIPFQIFLGVNELRFTTKPAQMGDKIYNQVFYQLGEEKQHKLSWALEYGEMDWDELEMALREFVSNALDAVGGKADKVKFAIVENPTPNARHTRVFIDLNRDVQKFYNELSTRFLHFSDVPQNAQIAGLIQKPEKSKGRIYRKGVYVRTLDRRSHFDYNFGDDVDIDECRNMSNYSATHGLTNVITRITDVGTLANVLRKVIKDQDCAEHEANSYTLKYRSDKDLWQQAYKNAFGDSLLCMFDNGALAHIAQQKGHTVIAVHSSTWYDSLSSLGIPTVCTGVDTINSKGHVITDASQETINTCDKVWRWLEQMGKTNGKNKPALKNFSAVVSGDVEILGYVAGNVVYINNDYQENQTTMLEELAHYITESTDMSRDFQTFAFSVGVDACRRAFV